MPLSKSTLHYWDRAVAVWRRGMAGEELHPLEYAAACAEILLSTLPRTGDGTRRRTWHDDDTEPLACTWSPDQVARGV